jgi:hypothetical protein
MIDDLEPLGVQRSFSVPISGPKGSLRSRTSTRAAQASALAKAGQGADSSAVNLDEDEQLLAIFRLAVWICRCPPAALPRTAKAALLAHAINNMNSLAKTARSVSTLALMVQMG